ncbi:MAG: FtsX-like permease family protein [Candidatus Dormiibacterota bacterium]
MLQRLGLLWRGLHWRLGTSALLLLVAAVAVFAATVGPLYLGTADGTVLHGTLNGQGAGQNAVTATATVESQQSEPLAQESLAQERKSPMRRWFGPGVLTVDVGIRTGVDQAIADLIYRPGVCSHLTFIQGHCARSGLQVDITQEDAGFLHLKLGSALLPEVPVSRAVGRNRNAPGKTIVPLEPSGQSLLVVGIIREVNRSAPYWLGDDFNGYSPLQSPPQLDSIWTTSKALVGQESISTAQFPLLVSQTRVAKLSPLKRAVNQFDSLVTTQDGLVPSTGLFNSLGLYGSEASVMAAIVVVVDLELVLLTLFVLYGLIVRSEETRLKEVALTKLRGFPRSAVLSAGLAEPLVLVSIALPVGFLAAWGAVALAAPTLLHSAVLLFTPPVFLAALTAYAGAILATVVGSRRILNRRLMEEVQGINLKPSATGRAVLDGAALALAIGGIVELVHSGVLTRGQPNPLSLLAPGLIAVALAVVGIRALPWLCRFWLRGAGSKSVAGALALRQVLRRPPLSRQMLVVVVATALVCFAGEAWSVANANRVERADFENGAARVLAVRVPGSLSLVGAVDKADPSGRYAMAVMKSSEFGGTLIAFDASRLGRVAYWPADLSKTRVNQVVHWLRGDFQPQLILTGSQVKVTVNYFGLPAGVPDLQFNLIDNGGAISVADFGYMEIGTHTYQANIPAACKGGCRVTSIQPYWQPNSTGFSSTTFSIQLSQLLDRNGDGTWHSPGVPLNRTRYWLPSQGASLVQVGHEVLFTFNEDATELLPPAVIPAPLPAILPGVSTYASQPSDPGVGSDIDFDGTPIYLNTKVGVVALPGVGRYGTLVDLPVAIDSETSYPVGAHDYVWLAPNAPSRVVQALRHEGVYIEDTSTPARLLSEYQQSGPALAFLFFLFAAIAAALLAVGSSVLSLTVSSRQRAYETAMLVVAGISRRDLFRALVGEQLLVLIPAACLGMIAGLGAAVAALPSVPEFVSTAGGPPLTLGLPVIPALALFAGLVVLLVAAALVAAYTTMRLVTVDRLRMEII